MNDSLLLEFSHCGGGAVGHVGQKQLVSIMLLANVMHAWKLSPTLMQKCFFGELCLVLKRDVPFFNIIEKAAEHGRHPMKSQGSKIKKHRSF